MKSAPNSRLKVVGLVSGASADGIDAALAQIKGSGPQAQIRLDAYRRYPYSAKMREAVTRALKPEESRVSDVAALDFALGELFAAAAVDVVRSAGVELSEIDLIGSHGQTVWHSPEQVEIGGMWSVSNLQIGEPSVIAERTGITVVADFRTADMAAGGRGAPLVPYADFVLFASANRNRAVQHVGDVGDVTYIPTGGKLDEIMAFDTGPGNLPIDVIVTRLTNGRLTYDAGGSLAQAGKPDRVILGQLTRHPFLEKRPPKETAREEFGLQFAEQLLSQWPNVSLENLAATVTAFIAQSIRRNYERWLPKLPDDIIVGGSGARNPALTRTLTEAFPRTKLFTYEDFGIGNDAKEALAFALLASEAIYNEPANVPAVTGAEKRVVLGKIVPGRNFRALMSKIERKAVKNSDCESASPL
ncbi:MAG TPA: anhydro-N-acetylmuramic acid kinase [Armatimonadota bacterium]|nr:anhydro-N-acetylmuramic acid kinase [Armatimonadota bacterium]